MKLLYTTSVYAQVELSKAVYEVSSTKAVLYDSVDARIELKGKKAPTAHELLLFPKLLVDEAFQIVNVSLHHRVRERPESPEEILFECSLGYSFQALQVGEQRLPAMSVSFLNQEAFFNTPETFIEVHKDLLSYYRNEILVWLSVVMFGFILVLRFFRTANNLTHSPLEIRTFQKYTRLKGRTRWVPVFHKLLRKYFLRKCLRMPAFKSFVVRNEDMQKLLYRMLTLTESQQQSYYAKVLLDEDFKTLLLISHNYTNKDTP